MVTGISPARVLKNSTFFAIFALVLVLYGLLLVRTGKKSYLPYRAMHSIRGEEDVRLVGAIVVRIGIAVGVGAAIAIIFGAH